MRFLILLVVLVNLAGCSYFHVHRMDIQQGNIITQDAVARVHRGMTKGQVKEILGEPVLANVFDNRRLDYVYYYQPGYGPQVRRYVTIIFKNGVVSEIKGNLYSAYIK